MKENTHRPRKRPRRPRRRSATKKLTKSEEEKEREAAEMLARTGSESDPGSWSDKRSTDSESEIDPNTRKHAHSNPAVSRGTYQILEER
ncbi:hypothetical protein NDU88_004609 [Pleurodeles waltl]|uniref:Uncharacterized protein n=1 Tax=Pleurodeles waltl TaxID=8319 RepID=A0AAV7QD79_PLEWA|nr:hypothetical protein NDU88_004609 [Pleurodeles waltl]